MFRSAGLALAFSLMVAAEVFAQGLPPPPFLPNFQGTPREQAACRPDVVKMCKELIQEGQGSILACLQRNRGRLSSACYEVLRGHGQVQ
jgi:hypothetical protein